MHKVHLDTDIGGDLDDLCALALLLGWPDVEITGVTTVLEHDGRRAGYAKRALTLAGRADVPVAAGADVSSGFFQLPAGLPDEAAYWPEPVTPLGGSVDDAVALLAASIEAGATVIGIGPYTNLCLLEQRFPGILGKTNVVLMGGCVNAMPDRCTDWDFRTDYNVQCHPEAARTVIEASDPTLVPIEVTALTSLTRDQLPTLQKAGRLQQLVAHQAEAFANEWHNEERYGRINFQHDPLACAVALGWSGATVEQVPVRLDLEGQSLHMRVDASKGQPLRVVTNVDSQAFSDLWLSTVVQISVHGIRPNS